MPTLVFVLFSATPHSVFYRWCYSQRQQLPAYDTDEGQPHSLYQFSSAGEKRAQGQIGGSRSSSNNSQCGLFLGQKTPSTAPAHISLSGLPAQAYRAKQLRSGAGQDTNSLNQSDSDGVVPFLCIFVDNAACAMVMELRDALLERCMDLEVIKLILGPGGHAGCHVCLRWREE